MDTAASEDTTKPPELAKPATTKKPKPKAKKRTKPKSKKKTKRPIKPAKTKTKKRKAVKSKAKKAVANGDARSERLDMRLTRAQKAKIEAKAKKTRRTVTSLVIEAIEKIR
jgi:hypothetical protein